MKILHSQTKQRESKAKGRYQEMEQQFCGVLEMKALNPKLNPALNPIFLAINSFI